MLIERRDKMPQYAILIYAPTPGDWSAAPPEELEAHGAYASKFEELGGTVVAGYALAPTTGAKSVSSQGIADGQFVQSDQALGGFTVIEARDLDHAVEIAKENPATWRGGVEVRELLG
jgi:hypothetical protein